MVNRGGWYSVVDGGKWWWSGGWWKTMADGIGWYNIVVVDGSGL